MKVSEKSLELNVGAELLGRMRSNWGMRKAYLRGLTQTEERQEGVDFFAHLDPNTRLFAFQFKAPKGSAEGEPYRYTLAAYQHQTLLTLAAQAPSSVFYVLPFYVTVSKLAAQVPLLSQDTWLLKIAGMTTTQVFGRAKTRTLRCWRGTAKVNPEFMVHSLGEFMLSSEAGMSPASFAAWYSDFRVTPSTENVDRITGVSRRRRNPWLARGLRVAIAGQR